MMRYIFVIMLSTIVSVYLFAASEVFASGRDAHICDSMKMDMQKEMILYLLTERDIPFKIESMERFYSDNEKIDEKDIPFANFVASYPREIIFGSVVEVNGTSIVFQIGIGGDDLISMIFCTKVYSP